MTSCKESAEIAYIANAYRDSPSPVTGQFTKGIQPNDLLSIYVESETPESTIQFNQETNKIATQNGSVLNPGASGARVAGYLVNHDGDIIFPVLGKVHVAGLTHNQLAEMLEKRLVSDGHIMDPVVTVKLMNFKVSVLGEVARPGMLNVDGERLTIFEALSMVGDMTIYGQRENVTVIREENGVRTVSYVDLTSERIFDSPYYYLHQNDVVYVEPNKLRKRTAESNRQLVLSYVSSGLGLISTIATIFYYSLLSRRLNQ